MMNGLQIVFWGVLTFSILVVLHEGGHFIAARIFGVKVHEFMVGLPGPRISFATKNTRYGITMIPLGGYVRIAGMEPGAEDKLMAPALQSVVNDGRMDAETLAARLGVDTDHAGMLLYTLADWGALEAADRDRSSYVPIIEPCEGEDCDDLLDRARSITFRGLVTWKRIVVLSAGVVVNIITALLVFTAVLSTWGYYEQSLTLEDVIPDSPVAEAGILPGDTLTSIAGETIEDWIGLTQALNAYDPDDIIDVTVMRDDEPLTYAVTLAKSPDNGGAYLGVVAQAEKVDLSILGAFAESLTWTGMVFATIFGMFFNADLFRQTLEGSRSVVGLSVEVAKAAATGPLDYAWWIALLSLSLGVMNVLPIPPLDGGKIVIEVIQKIMGRPIERRLAVAISLSGAVLLFSFIGYVMYSDVMRYFVAT